jgi:hypothetical protein
MTPKRRLSTNCSIYIFFAGFQASDWDSPTGIAQEQVIESIARGLVNLKRRYEAMGKKGGKKGGAMIPGASGRPKGQSMPEGAGAKMVKGKGGAGKGKMCK